MSSPLLLLVDDAPEMGVIVRSLGKRAGCEVETRKDVAGAWDFLQRHTPDLILLDVNLGGVSGLELCRRVRAAPVCKGVSIALFGQWGLPDDVAAGLEAGVDFVLCKDLICRPREWQGRLHEILTLAHGRSAPWLLGLGAVEEVPGGIDGCLLLRRSVQHASIRWLGSAVLGALTRRALARTFGSHLPAEWAAWLAPEGTPAELALAPPSLRPEVAAALSLSLSEWFWRLLGTEASAPVRAYLAAAVPRGWATQSPR